MDNQSKRIADLVIELIGAMKVELTPTGTRVEDIQQIIDASIDPFKEEIRREFVDHVVATDNNECKLVERIGEAESDISDLDSKVDDIESRVSDLEDTDEPDIDVDAAVERYCDSWAFKSQLAELIDESVRENVPSNDDIKVIVRAELKNALDVLIAHWADN